jgi:hypothetical protein
MKELHQHRVRAKFGSRLTDIAGRRFGQEAALSSVTLQKPIITFRQGKMKD